jgi:hypothetical protein
MVALGMQKNSHPLKSSRSGKNDIHLSNGDIQSEMTRILGRFYRRIRSRFGPASAIKATAHKLAKIVCDMLTTKKSYTEAHFVATAEQFNQERINRLHKEAAGLGYKTASA